MTTLKTKTRRTRAGGTYAARDRSIALIIVFMMGLVFVPVLGLHVAAAFGGLDVTSEIASAPSPSSATPNAVSASRDAKDRRG
ncbi:hypothetical protein [Methylobacterium oxalidis]|uniref:hypothetical protein n=1 Tax=Methylobacterium oxalidis TaxID=944322 RepID=UPI003315BC64